MKSYKLPVPYFYCILIGLALGIILGSKVYLSFLFWEELDRFRWERHFLPNFINQALWGFLVPIVFYFYQKYSIGKEANNISKASAIGASILVALFHELFSYVIWFLPLHLLGIQEFSSKQLHMIKGAIPQGFVNQWVQYWIIYLVLFALESTKKIKDKQVELAQMESQLSNAQLTALKLQLQPHFLFNTLNTISSLMEINIKDSQKIVSKLGILLRTVLDKDKRNTLPLREELEFIKSYLGIEQVRFHDRLEIAYDIDESALEAQVPNLILQPLVENAIKHGFAQRTDKGIISVRAKKVDNGRVEIIVKDDGCGSELSTEQLFNKGIGLKNIKDRLELIYNDNFDLIVNTGPEKGFEVIIHIPFSWFPEVSEAGI